MVNRDGVIFAGGFGIADRESGRAVDDGTVFRVGSVSKTVTAVLALQQVERGTLDLHAPVDLPVGDEAVTLFQLLTHTAGFGESFPLQHAWDADGPRLAGDDPARSGHRCDVTRRVGSSPTTIGARPSPAGASRSRADSRSRNVHATICSRRFDMSRSTFEQVAPPDDVLAHMAVAYRLVGDELRPYPRDFVNTTPAAGMFTCARDMARFLLAIVREGEIDGTRVLSAASTRALTTRQFAAAEGMKGRGFGFAENDRNGWGGFHKDGQASGFSARIEVLPEAGVAWFSAHNRAIIDPGPIFHVAGSFHRRLGAAIVDRFFPRRPADGDPVERAPPADLQADLYVGTYRDVTNPRHTFETALLVDEVAVDDAGHRLIIAGLPFLPLADGRFQHEDRGPHFYHFVTDESGRARYLQIGYGTYERLAWWETSAFLMRVAVVAGLLLLLAPAAALIARLRRRDAPRGAWLASMVLIGWLVHGGALAAALLTMDPQEIFHDAPARLVLAQWLVVIPTAVSAGLLGRALRARASVAVAVSPAVASALMIWLLHSRHLLPGIC